MGEKNWSRRKNFQLLVGKSKNEIMEQKKKKSVASLLIPEIQFYITVGYYKRSNLPK